MLLRFSLVVCRPRPCPIAASDRATPCEPMKAPLAEAFATAGPALGPVALLQLLAVDAARLGLLALLRCATTRLADRHPQLGRDAVLLGLRGQAERQDDLVRGLAVSAVYLPYSSIRRSICHAS